MPIPEPGTKRKSDEHPEHGAKKKKINMEGIDPDGVYPMKLPKLGHAVIINNLAKDNNFKGTKKDVEALKEVFEEVEFEVKIHTDCTSKDMRNIRDWIKVKADHSQCNCFLMVIISHGTKKGNLLDTDGRESFDIDALIEEIAEVRTLNGKPKLFLFDACRGDNNRYDNRGKAIPSDEDETMKDVKWPDLSDVFVAYPTMPGYMAYGGLDDGSIYQHAFAYCLKKYFRSHDWSSIHLAVKQIMAREAQEDNTMQPAEERNGLRYLLKFGDFHGEPGSSKTVPELTAQIKELEEDISRLKMNKNTKTHNMWEFILILPSIYEYLLRSADSCC